MARSRNNKKHSSGKKTGKLGKGNGEGQAETSSVQLSSSDTLQYSEVVEGAFEGRKSQATPSSASFDDVAKPQEPRKDHYNDKEKENVPGHEATSLRGVSGNFSSRMEGEKRRTHSLAGEQVRDNTEPAGVQTTRAEAITLIRARTLSRLSDTDQPSGEFLAALLQEKPASPKEPSESDTIPDNMVYETANIVDYVVNKKKKKKKKGKNAAAEEDLLAELAKTEGSSVSPPVLQQEQDGSEKLDAGDGAAPVSKEQMTDGQCSSNKVDKGKQRVAVVDADVLLESKGVNKDVTLPEADPSIEDKESDATEEFTEDLKALNVTEAKDPKTSQSSSKQASCRRENFKKNDPLSPIKEGEVQHVSASESPVVGASTPKSTGTISASTGWTPTSNQATLTTTATAPSTERRGKTAKKTSDKGASTSTTQSISNHAHPYPVTNRDIQQLSTQGGCSITSKKPDNFFWQLDSHGFPCSKQFCEKRCNLWDGATVICPRCGPYSEVRYCSRKHLLEDVKAHWLICGEMSFRHPCVDSSIPSSVRDSPPLIPSQLPHNSLERHRQAVHFNMNTRAGDYFIFSDWVDIIAAKSTPDDFTLRCSSRIIHTVKFTDPAEKDRFRRVLAACLFVTFESCPLVDYLFRMIRDNLPPASESATSAETLVSLESSLKYQVFREFTVRIQPYITGKRHACPSDWTGRNRRNCPDEVCRAERKRLLGTLGGSGQEALIQHLEASYWILRASRTTHPTVSSAKERMMGNGFEDVAEEDCRKYCRGDGWDGAGSGEMEIEEANN